MGKASRSAENESMEDLSTPKQSEIIITADCAKRVCLVFLPVCVWNGASCWSVQSWLEGAGWCADEAGSGLCGQQRGSTQGIRRRHPLWGEFSLFFFAFLFDFILSYSVLLATQQHQASIHVNWSLLETGSRAIFELNLFSFVLCIGAISSYLSPRMPFCKHCVPPQAQVFAEIGEVINGTAPAHREKTTVYKSLGKLLSSQTTNHKHWPFFFFFFCLSH